MYDQPSPARRFGPALIAFLVVLAAAAGAVGYFGAKQILAANGSALTGPTSSAPATGVRTTPPTGPTSPTVGPTSPKTSTTTTATVPAGDGSTCPTPTADAVGAAGLDNHLVVQLYVRVHRAGETDSEIWICKNNDGLLIYQGHILRSALTTADDARDSLLLATGIKGTVAQNVDEYVASNPNNGTTTEYHVTRDKLVRIQQPGDRNRTEYQVVNVFPQ